MAVAKDIITGVLRTSLLRFIKDASGEQLHLRHLLSGHVEVGPDVALAEPAIQQVLLDIGFPASVEVISAHADNIRVHIPWAKLLGQSSRLVIGQLTVQVRIHDVESLAQVLEGVSQDPPKVEHSFLVRQRERLEVMVDKRCSKPPEGLVRRLTLLETVIQGLRAQFNNVKLEIFRDIDGYENPPTVGPFLTMELHGITISPCTNAKRPTLELAEARTVMDMAGSLPEPLKPYAFRRMFRMDRADAWVLRAAGKPCNALPWQSQKEWCLAARFGTGCLRASIYQACTRTGRGGALMVEECGALLGIERVIDLESPEGAEQAALDVDMEGAMALELAQLGGHFFSGFPITAAWRRMQVQRGLPAIVGLTEPHSEHCHSRRSSVTSEEEVVEPVKEAVDNVLRESFLSQRGSRRSSALSAVLDKVKRVDPGERLLISGWLTKRANLRPFQDSWQARWCEVSQLPQGHGILRYSAQVHDAPGQMQLKGEIALVQSSDAYVMSFEDAKAANAGGSAKTISGYLEHWSRPNADRIVEEFQHGFLLQTAKEGAQAGRMFFFVTERESESRRWVAAIHSVLQKPQSLEDFLGETLPELTGSPAGSVAPFSEEKDYSEVATEDVSDEDSANSFVSVEDDELVVTRPSFLWQDEPTIEATLSKMKQFSTIKLNLSSLKVRVGLGEIANPLQGLLDEAVPECIPLHAELGNLQLNLISQSQPTGAAVAPVAKLMALPPPVVDGFLQKKATWSTSRTIELTVGDVNIKRTDIPRNIASGKGPGPIIRMMFEQQLELVAAWKPEEQLKAAHISGALTHLFATLDVPALMTIQIFLLKLGKAFSPDVPTLMPPQQIEALEALKSMEPHSLQMRLEDLEVEVPLPGLPVSGHGLRITIAAMQLASMDALQSFAASMRRMASGRSESSGQ